MMAKQHCNLKAPQPMLNAMSDRKPSKEELLAAAGTLAEARVRGLDLSRDIYIVRASGRAGSAAAQAFVAFARDQLG